MSLFDCIKKVLELSSERFRCIRNLPIYISTDGETAHLLDNIEIFEISNNGCVLLLKSSEEITNAVQN